MKKLITHKNSAQLAINVLCNLTNEHCNMCKWEQEVSDNPLLLDPKFACQFIKERKLWLIEKNKICANCLLISKLISANNNFRNANLINTQNVLHDNLIKSDSEAEISDMQKNK